jgi:hypothetical protein
MGIIFWITIPECKIGSGCGIYISAINNHLKNFIYLQKLSKNPKSVILTFVSY